MWLLGHLSTLSSTLNRNQCWIFPQGLWRTTAGVTILHAAVRQNATQVLHEAATVYKVDTDAIALKVRQEFAAKDKLKKTPKAVSKAKKAA
jgi:ParB family chromosome partitioning protein